MELVVLRALLLCVLPLISILYLAIKSMNVINIIIINEYKELCQEYIYQEMIKEDSCITFGMILTEFDKEKVVLPTLFYKNYIINKETITHFLNEITWLSIIEENKFKFDIIKELLSNQYKKYIIEKNILHNIATITKRSLFDAEMAAAIAIADYLTLFPEIPKLPMIYTHITEIINKVEWVTYIQSIECQLGEYSELKKFAKEKILLLSNENIIDPVSELFLNSAVEKKFMDDLIEIFDGTLVILWVLPQTLYYSFFKESIRTIAVSIAIPLTTRLPYAIVFNMNQQEIQDFFLRMIVTGIENHGVIGVFWTFIKIRYFL